MYNDLDKVILKTILTRGIKDCCVDMINLNGKGGIPKYPYDDMVTLLFRSLRASSGSINLAWDDFSRVQKSANGWVARVEIDSFFEKF